MSSITQCPQPTSRPTHGLVEKILHHHCFHNRTSLLAALESGEDRPLQVIEDANGTFALGVPGFKVDDEDPGSYWRDSVECWATRTEAEQALLSRQWTQDLDG